MKKVKFYNREDLCVENVVELISIWEAEAAESFVDYCSFSGDEFLEFLKTEYLILYKEVIGAIDCTTVQQIVKKYMEYCTEWIPADKCELYEAQYNLTIYPLAEFILVNDNAWKEFVDLLTNDPNIEYIEEVF